MKHIMLSLCLVLMLRVTWQAQDGVNMGVVIGSYYDTTVGKTYLLVRKDIGMGQIVKVEYDKVIMSTLIKQ